MRRLQKLRDSHRAAIRMRIEGKKIEDIAKALNVSETTLYVWFSDDLVKRELAVQRERINDVFADKLAEAGLVAIQQMIGLAQMDTVEDQLTISQKAAIIEQVLNRLPLTPTNRERVTAAQQGDVSGNVFNVLNLSDATDSDLRDRAKEIAARMGFIDAADGSTGNTATD